MPDILAFTIFVLIFTVGEYVAVKTKANIDVVLFVAVVLLIGFWIGLPSDIYEVSGILPISGIVITLLIVGMGNMIDFAELKKTVENRMCIHYRSDCRLLCAGICRSVYHR